MPRTAREADVKHDELRPFLDLHATGPLDDGTPRCPAASLSEQQRRQQQQLQEFFSDVDVLASTETASAFLHDRGAADDSAFERLYGDDDDGSVIGPGALRGGMDARGWMASGGGGRGGGVGVAKGYGGGAAEEGAAAVAVRKSVYHLRQLRQARVS